MDRVDGSTGACLKKCWSYVVDDIQYTRRRILHHPELILSNEQLERFALEEIERLLQSRGKSLHDYPPMPTVVIDSLLSSNDKLIYEELCYDQTAMSEEHSTLFKSLTDEQLRVYETIMQSVNEEVGGVFSVWVRWYGKDICMEDPFLLPLGLKGRLF
ncbi:unnamed protein product [Cuscuta europaea]|uniref:Uncharacterized protein n=1 Tax=Cuscuta europaea TaxID=41803 RepID=A0A9P0ZE87_CUSEU|nr:unnamed protein product [Cuscuta europaea]